ncbi:hypothetical protein COV81_04235 [Candidatus Peregrinibacteria bacterium CG11_big_fil_rev_8_21_14_0_20_41_10]|nr:MAG: hypothetical protein COV81_04235 [Candidatus Peregrinibacteria bacterium CG11_big_fil_rev_8_21_14_0_20_41_10]PIZ74545.1 MAG: hypothetical protein COY06_04020 [Candidatus Peregrinibacteria bacterium CG_4_10_14_0_2_um_filter_41_8]PJC38154.1 MAG: hypothetical protein CO045_01800 [Candidatus Peregrinibacteria bacterium CG_4_9_14_0_2_um_filter_41_14]
MIQLINQIHDQVIKIIDQVQTQMKATPWTFFLFNPRIATLAIATIIIMGAFALFNINIEANPEINQPIGLVQTFYPNSSPSDVEEQITNPLEEEIAKIDKVDSIESTSSSNISSITVTFETGSDNTEILNDLREAANSVTLPNDAEVPKVIEFDFNNQSIITISVVGNVPEQELSAIAEHIKDDISDISGVGKIELSGDLQENVQITLDSVKLSSYNLGITEVIQAINSSNLNSPLGEIQANNNKINLRLVGKAETIQQLQQIPLRTISDETTFNIITLSQVADIFISSEPKTTQSFVNLGEQEAAPAVSLNVFKKNGGNIVKIIKEIEAKIAEINTQLPPGVGIAKTNDNAFSIRKDIKTLSWNGFQTIIIIFFALLVFLTFTEAFIAAIAIPIIFLMTFAYVYFTGQTLNSLTIFSLILSLGLIVDTSIVIVEGIHDNRKEGQTPQEAAYNSINTFKWPLVGGTLTTIAAFFPMLLVSGIIGDFIKTIPIVLTITLASSLFVSIAFSPLLASKILSGKKDEPSFKDQFIKKLRYFYKDILTGILKNSGLKAAIVIITIILFVASLSLPFIGVLQAQLFPTVDVPFIYINIEAPEGTPLAETHKKTEVVEAILIGNPNIQNYVLNIGRQVQTSFGFGDSSTSSNQASFIINLDPDETTRPRSYVIAEDLRKQLATLNTDLTIKLEEISAGPPTAAPIEARITGPNLDEIKNIADKITTQLQQTPGIININSQFDNQPEEAVLTFNKDLLNYYGLSASQAGIIIQSLTNGVDVGSITIQNKEYDLKLHLQNNTTKNLQEIKNLTISTPKGQIPLSYIGQIETQPALRSIPHVDQDRTARVRAFTEKDVLISDLLPTITEKIDQIELSSEYNIDLGGENEDINDSFTDLFSSMIIAVILILVILVAVFNSFRQTFIVLMTIPLAVIGIFPALTIFGQALSFPAFLGVVMLTGIVVNDAIVLIDQINKNRQKIDNLNEAIAESGQSRLMPIILTSITTILGLLPITISDEFWRGLGFSVIAGLLAATFLTLFIIPILYSSFYRSKK